MTNPVITIAPNALVEEALDLMLQHSISGLPVVEHGRLVGLISEFDTLMLLFESPSGFRLIEPVASFMTVDVECVREDDPIFEAGNLFRRRSVRRLPVLRGDAVVGVISRRNLVKIVREERCKLALSQWEFDVGAAGSTPS